MAKIYLNQEESKLSSEIDVIGKSVGWSVIAIHLVENLGFRIESLRTIG
jgi:hypothetical protein